MSRQNYLLAVLSGIFTILLLANLFLWQAGDRREAADSGSGEEEVLITDLSVADIGGAAVKNSSGSYGLLQENGALIMMDEPEADWSVRKMNAFVFYFSHLRAVKTVEAEESLAEYGLDPADSVITLLLTNGEKVRLSLGKANPMDGAYYLQKEGDENLYLVEALAAALAEQSKDDFRDMRLFPDLDETGLNSLTQIQIQKDGSFYTLERTTKQGTSYRLSWPVEVDINWELADRMVIAPLQALEPETFVSSGRPLSEYGLDSPEKLLELTMDGRQYRIGFSEADGESLYCAELSGQMVYKVKKEQTEFLDAGYMVLLGDSVYTRNIAEISNLTLTDGTNRYSLKVKGEGENISGSLNGNRLDYLDIVQFYRNISQIPIAGELSQGESVGPKPLVTMTVQLRKGDMDVISFLPLSGSDRLYAVSLNGQIQFTTYRSVMEDIISAFRLEVE